MMRQDVIYQLFHEIYANQRDGRKWGVKWATACERAGYRCEYCGKDMLASLDDYRSIETEHIIPRSAGGSEELDNLALSCPVCNSQRFKGRYNPAKDAGEGASRDKLIQAVKEHLIKKRVENYKEFLRYRLIVGYPCSYQ